ncbi:hypothetical protein Clacol_006313 [Clathrus columnatus]|uniref:t-SNARE coiled-coil homology domain-containing protein n=1 Tax=Clathrus columnatus TaxID=1419009 RepID=A0AAV5AEK1_9AGAM|nr:hypothetical protein Clacol_006313 [Clathrus columnatus]
MARDRLSALRTQQENLDRNTTINWLYPPGLTQPDQHPVLLPRVPAPVTYSRVPITYLPVNRQLNQHNAANNSDTRMACSNITHFRKDPPISRPLVAKSLPPKPIMITLEDDMTKFYAEIAAIQENLRVYNDNISRISELHSRALDSMDWVTSKRSTHQVNILMAETRGLGNDLKLRIKNIHAARKGEKTREVQIRKQQAALVKHKFIQAIEKYLDVEQLYRHRYRQRLEKQLKIANPEAKPEEVQAAVDGQQDLSQVFAQMLHSCNRFGESRAVFREVQERHDDIKKIERTLYELAQLFNDMDTLVMAQGEIIDEITIFTNDVEKSTEIGYIQMGKATKSARARRTKKWICVGVSIALFIIFIISMTILIIAAANGNV